MSTRMRTIRSHSRSRSRRQQSGGIRKKPEVSRSEKGLTKLQRAHKNENSFSPAEIQSMQSSLGNQAVLRMMSSAKSKPGGLVDHGLESAIQRSKGSGDVLPPTVRSRMERNFGVDLSSVEVHDDSQADRMSDSLQARAFTTGSQIFFKRGEYRPKTRDGQRLLAHELTHVVQQNAANLQAGKVINRSPLTEKNPAISPAGEKPLIQGSWLTSLGKKIGSFAGKLFKRAINAFKFVRNRLKQSCGGKIDAKESKNILEHAFVGHKFKVDRIKVVDEAGIKKAWDKIYGEGSYDGSNGKEADGPLEGFTAPDNTIYINSSAQEVDTMPHEILHRHENGVVINKMGENFNEGFTEYLTQKAVSAMGYKPTSSYPDDLAVVKKMVPLIGGDEVLEKAYFDGDLATLKKAFEKKKGKGSFKLLVSAMKAGNYADANKILDAKTGK